MGAGTSNPSNLSAKDNAKLLQQLDKISRKFSQKKKKLIARKKAKEDTRGRESPSRSRSKEPKPPLKLVLLPKGGRTATPQSSNSSLKWTNKPELDAEAIALQKIRTIIRRHETLPFEAQLELHEALVNLPDWLHRKFRSKSGQRLKELLRYIGEKLIKDIQAALREAWRLEENLAMVAKFGKRADQVPIKKDDSDYWKV